MKTRPVGAELFHADRRTDRHDEAIVAVSNFANAPKSAVKIKKMFFDDFFFSLKCAVQLRKSAICMFMF